MDNEVSEIIEFFEAWNRKIQTAIAKPSGLATPVERAVRTGTLMAFSEVLEALQDTIAEHGV